MTVTERLIPARQWTRMPHFLERASSEGGNGGGRDRKEVIRELFTHKLWALNRLNGKKHSL